MYDVYIAPPPQKKKTQQQQKTYTSKSGWNLAAYQQATYGPTV